MSTNFYLARGDGVATIYDKCGPVALVHDLSLAAEIVRLLNRAPRLRSSLLRCAHGRKLTESCTDCDDGCRRCSASGKIWSAISQRWVTCSDCDGSGETTIYRRREATPS